MLTFEFSPCSGMNAVMVIPHMFPGQECMLEKPFSPTVNVCVKVKYGLKCPTVNIFKTCESALNLAVFLWRFEMCCGPGCECVPGE